MQKVINDAAFTKTYLSTHRYRTSPNEREIYCSHLKMLLSLKQAPTMSYLQTKYLMMVTPRNQKTDKVFLNSVLDPFNHLYANQLLKYNEIQHKELKKRFKDCIRQFRLVDFYSEVMKVSRTSSATSFSPKVLEKMRKIYDYANQYLNLENSVVPKSLFSTTTPISSQQLSSKESAGTEPVLKK